MLLDEEIDTTPGLPDSCDPDGDGVTWIDAAFGGRRFTEFTFEDHVEAAVRSYAPSARVIDRKQVEAILQLGVVSRAALERFARLTHDSELRRVAD